MASSPASMSALPTADHRSSSTVYFSVPANLSRKSDSLWRLPVPVTRTKLLDALPAERAPPCRHRMTCRFRGARAAHPIPIASRRRIAQPLWDSLFEAGEDLNVSAGGPNLIERIEGGLLSYGNDMTAENTPHECGLDRFCQVEQAIGCVGRDALLRVCQEGPIRQIRSPAIEGDAVKPCIDPWPVVVAGKTIGRITSAAWSPDFETNVAIGMIRMPHWDDGTCVEVVTPDGTRRAVVKGSTFTSTVQPDA